MLLLLELERVWAGWFVRWDGRRWGGTLYSARSVYCVYYSEKPPGSIFYIFTKTLPTRQLNFLAHTACLLHTDPPAR